MYTVRIPKVIKFGENALRETLVEENVEEQLQSFISEKSENRAVLSIQWHNGMRYLACSHLGLNTLVIVYL